MKVSEASGLMEAAREARRHAYAPYSGYAVGAALLAANGRVFCGCNVENAAFTPTCCAERVALFTAVAAGVRDFCALAVCGGPAGGDTAPCTPCGVCRQALREFCDPGSFRIYTEAAEGIREYRLSELLPDGFGPENLRAPAGTAERKEAGHEDV